MNTLVPRRLHFSHALAAIALSAALTTSLHAGNLYWSGNSNTATTNSNNWVGLVAPVASPPDNLFFTAASYSNQPTFALNYNINSLVFGNGTNASAAVTITNSGFLALLQGGGIVMNSNAGGVTVNGNNWLRIGVSQTWVNNSTNGFTNNANIINGAGTNPVPTVTLTGTGTFALGTLNQTTGTNNYAVSMTDNGTVIIGLSDSRGRITLNSGRLGLSAANSLGSSGFGNLVINGGTLQAQANTTIGNSNNITISNSFTYGSSDRPNRILNTGIGAVSLSNSATINTFSGDLQLGGVIGDGGNARGITKAGAGTLTLVAANTFSGGTTNSAGILILSNSLALQNSALDTSNSITGDTTNGIRATTTALTLGGLAGNKNLADVFTTTSGGYGSVTALTLNPGANANHDYSGVIANGAMTLTKNGAGTQVLSGTNTYTGGTTISAGTLQIGNGADSGSIASTAAVTNNGALVYNVGAGVRTLGAVISGGGSLTQNSAGGSLTLTASNTYIGPTIISAGILQIGGGTDSGSIASTSAVTNNGALVYNVGAGVRTIAAPISGTGSLTQNSAGGSLTLSGTNTYSGNTTVNASSTLALATNGSLRFVIGGSGTNNAVTGTGTTTMSGQFAFDLTGASTSTNSSWIIVANTLGNSYGTNFIVTGFSGAGGNWTNTTNGVNYVFAQSNSVLSVQSTGGVTPYNAWVGYWQGIDSTFTNTAGTDNPDGDPFDNNEEFAFDGNPTIGTGALLTATQVGTNAVFNYVAQTNTNAVTYLVQNTTNLSTGPWTNASVTISNSTNQGGISQTNIYERKEFVVPGTSNQFFRVQATIAP